MRYVRRLIRAFRHHTKLLGEMYGTSEKINAGLR